VRCAIAGGSVVSGRGAPGAKFAVGEGWQAYCERLEFGWRPGKYLSVRSVEACTGGPIRPRAKIRERYVTVPGVPWPIPESEAWFYDLEEDPCASLPETHASAG
jgi:hypothetical protein